MLQHVQILNLDGLSVPSNLISDIILHDSFSVRILSIREVKHLNQRILQQALQYAVRPSRPPNTPKLQGLYIFGQKDANWQSCPEPGDSWHESVTRERWYRKSGQVITETPALGWPQIVGACLGIISFDAVLCPGCTPFLTSRNSSHDSKETSCLDGVATNLATHAVQGCNRCHSSPEGFSVFGKSPHDHFPLLAPPPLRTSTAKAAKTPFIEHPPAEKRIVLRCMNCLPHRYCQSCHDWWCESCYDPFSESTSKVCNTFL